MTSQHFWRVGAAVMVSSGGGMTFVPSRQARLTADQQAKHHSLRAEGP
jgi:hypothetical protein